MSLEEPLLSNASSSTDFGVTKEELMKLFESENRIADHGGICESREILDKLGNANGLLKALDSKENNGILDTQKNKDRRATTFGTNERREIKIRGICEMIAEQFEDKILRILIVAALVSL